MEIRTLLVDSSFLLKRSFDGAKNVYSENYGHIGALYSFLTTVRKLIKKHRINKVVLVWDGENSGKHRYMLYNEYKANRKNKEWHEKIEMSDAEIRREKEKKESLLKQRKRIQAYAEELFLRQIEIDDIEGDDIIAYYCMNWSKKEEIFLYTNDRDFVQLLDFNITILFDNMEQPIDNVNFFFYFPYHYSNSLTIKVICGDSSDNISGVGGISKDTLLKLFPDMKVRHYTVKEICQNVKKMNEERIINKKKPLKAYENLLNNVKKLKLSHRLVNLKEPFLTSEAIEEIKLLHEPLSINDRGSKILFKMMKEDGFLSVYNGTFPSYVEPFYTVIMKEKELYKKLCV